MSFLKKTTIFLLVVFLAVSTTRLYSNDDICPKDMSLDQCYNYLNKKMSDLEKQSKAVSQSLSTEKYNQLTLNQQIEYVTRKIAESEMEIKRTEIELEAKNVEIRMMERDIEETQNNIATVLQESKQLESSISKRLTMSYKYSFMNPLELLVKSQDLDILLRKMKYLIETRRNDKILLSEMKNKSVVLDAEERVLGKRKLDLEKARIDVEDKKTQLFNQKESLAVQQGEQTRLLGISKQKEASYEATLEEIKAAQNQVTQQITTIIRRMYEQGQIAVDRQVKKGDVIGFQGYTGFTYGSHLNLEVYNSNGYRVNPFPQGLFTGGALYSSVGSAAYHYPLDGGILTQTFHGGHSAIDIQSATYGDQTGDKYYGAEIRCLGMVRQAGYYNTRGTGAAIRAIESGYVSKVYTDVCGGKYVVLKHDDGGSSLYLHLK